MAFGLEIHMEKPDSGMFLGTQKEVACDCWFSSSGRTIPHLIKFEDEEGIIQTLKDIQVISAEDKAYLGIKTKVYNCKTVFEERETLFRLIFRKEECRWYMVI